MAAGFENRHAFDACLEQRILDGIQLGRLENRFNLEHGADASFDSVTGLTVVGLISAVVFDQMLPNVVSKFRRISGSHLRSSSRSLPRCAGKDQGRRPRLRLTRGVPWSCRLQRAEPMCPRSK